MHLKRGSQGALRSVQNTDVLAAAAMDGFTAVLKAPRLSGFMRLPAILPPPPGGADG
jgi:hypothetical protein